MKLSVIIPVYNEKNTIGEIIAKVEKSDIGALEKEIIVVDDLSSDGTRDVLASLEKSKRVRVFYHEQNTGKGGALRTGFLKATGDIVLIQDADLEYDPDEYMRLISPILENKADVVYGSRFMGGAPHRVNYFWHKVANNVLTLISNAFSDLALTDMETCYKVFTKKVIEKIRIEENRFGFEPEITAKIGRLARETGIRVYEVGISYYGRTYEEGKKIGWRDAVWAFWCIMKYNSSFTAKLFKSIITALAVFLLFLLLLKYAIH